DLDRLSSAHKGDLHPEIHIPNLQSLYSKQALSQPCPILDSSVPDQEKNDYCSGALERGTAV
ncbi:MAG: hypothetical protein M3Y72_11385, partial [Acidobacteriota bacterium]|nr:hypothetical protein [Acidobacteriota bacterium]